MRGDKAAGGQRGRYEREELPAGSPRFDSLVFALYCVAAFGCAVFYGGTVFWTSGPFIVLTMLGVGLLSVQRLLSGPPTGLRFPPGTLLVFLFSAYLLLRALLAPVIPYQIWTELYQVLTFFLLYLGVTQAAGRKRLWLWGLGGFLLLMSAEALYAIVQQVNGSTQVLWLERPEQYGMRASGTLICPNHFAQLLQVAIVVGVGLLLMPGVGVIPRLFAGFLFVTGAPALILSGSRSGWIGTAAGVGALLALRALRRGWKKVLWTGLAFVVGLSLLSVILYTQVDSVKARVDKACRGGLSNADIRTSQLWPDTLLLIEDVGAAGSGPGTFRHIFSGYRENFNNPDLYLRYAHNEYLHTLAEYGWVSWVLFAGVLALHGRLAFRAWRGRSEVTAMIWAMWFSVLFASSVHAVFDFNAHLPGNMLPLALLSGLFAARLHQLGSLDPFPLHPTGYRVLLCCVLFCSVGIIAVTVPLYRASKIEYAIETADQNRDLSARFRHGRLLQEVMPIHWLGHRIEGQNFQSSATWCRDTEKKARLVQQSRQAYERALQWNPYDLPSRMGLATLLGIQKELEAALREWEAICKLAPMNQRVFIQRGLVLRDLDRLDEALEVFLHADKLKRKNRQVALNIRSIRRQLAERKKKDIEQP